MTPHDKTALLRKLDKIAFGLAHDVKRLEGDYYSNLAPALEKVRVALREFTLLLSHSLRNGGR